MKTYDAIAANDSFASVRNVQQGGSELVENAEYMDHAGRKMKIISIESGVVYYGTRGEIMFRPRKASIEQFKNIAGLTTHRSNLRLVVNKI